MTRHAWRTLATNGVEYVCRNYRSRPGGNPDRTLYLARYLMQEPLALAKAVSGACDVHHRDQNPYNNCDWNLEIVPARLHRQMHRLQKPPKPGKLKGVYRYPYGQKHWIAYVGDDKIGVFDTEAEAGLARDLVAREVYGPTVYLNFPAAVAEIRRELGEEG